MVWRCMARVSDKQVGTVTAEDFMDDVIPIRLAVTVDRTTRSALFDFEGTASSLAWAGVVLLVAAVSAVVIVVAVVDAPLFCGAAGVVVVGGRDGNGGSPCCFDSAGGILVSPRIQAEREYPSCIWCSAVLSSKGGALFAPLCRP